MDRPVRRLARSPGFSALVIAILAINIATGTMKETLGEKAYDEALATDVMARQAAQNAGALSFSLSPEEVEAISQATMAWRK